MQKNTPKVKKFLKDVEELSRLKISPKYAKLTLQEYPFDAQLLNLSRLYRLSRKFYLDLGGTYERRLCSTMRSLSAQDLFKNQIDFSPAQSELMWFKDHVHEVSDPEVQIGALTRFNDISLFHEQNHRVIWRMLPPAPQEERDLRRYLNFAESLVVTLDLALGDEVGKKLSPVFERLNLLYRPGRERVKEGYRNYLLSLFCATYYLLERIEKKDILKAVDYVLPGQKKINKEAVRRSLELNEHFTDVTNPEWQKRYAKSAAQKLKKMHAGSDEAALYLPEDPLDLESEFFYVRRMFDDYGL